MAETADAVLSDFSAQLNDLNMFHGLLAMGFDRVVDWLASRPRSPENPNPQFGLVHGDRTTQVRLTFARLRFSEVASRLERDPPGDWRVRLTQEWVVFVSALWDEEIRPRLAVAHHVAVGDIAVLAFGDLWRLRHDVIHHRGVASAAWTGRCELFRWFQPGDVLDVDAPKQLELLKVDPLGGACCRSAVKV